MASNDCKYYGKVVALLLWSALFIYGCTGSKSKGEEAKVIKIMESQNPEMITYEAKRTLYRMKAPKMERYQGKDTLYTIFGDGIYVESFDSLGNVESWLRANYAISYEDSEIWEARDSVVGQDKDGKRIYTDTLFWDRKKKRIYSPSTTRVVSGEESVLGINGFESDEGLENILFYNSKGRITIDTVSNEEPKVSELDK